MKRRPAALARWIGLLLLPALIACAPSAGTTAPAPSGAAAAPAVAAPVATVPAPLASELQALIEGARREGQLNLVWAESALGGSQMAPRLAAGFNRLYGLNVNVQFTPGPNMVEMGGRLAQEYQANRTASTDVYVGPARAIGSLLQADALTSVDWMAWAPNIQNASLVASGGGAVEVASFVPGITYNSNKLTGDAVPTSLQDLLKPQYRGRIATTPYAAFFDSLASPEGWGEQRGLDYVRQLSDQVAGLMGCGEGTRLVSGEFDLFAIDCGSFDARQQQAQGAPLGHVIPSDAVLLLQWYLAVPRTAAHPNAGKLFVNYMLGREGQDYVYEAHYTDHPLVEGSKVRPDLEKARASGARVITLDVAFRQRNDEKELDRVLGEVQRILRRS